MMRAEAHARLGHNRPINGRFSLTTPLVDEEVGAVRGRNTSSGSRGDDPLAPSYRLHDSPYDIDCRPRNNKTVMKLEVQTASILFRFQILWGTNLRNDFGVDQLCVTEFLQRVEEEFGR